MMAAMADPRLQGLDRAIGVLTAWLEGGGPSDPEAELVGETILANVGEGFAAEVEMMRGLVHLSGFLLVRLAKCEGRSEAEILQDLARRHTA